LGLNAFTYAMQLRCPCYKQRALPLGQSRQSSGRDRRGEVVEQRGQVIGQPARRTWPPSIA